MLTSRNTNNLVNRLGVKRKHAPVGDEYHRPINEPAPLNPANVLQAYMMGFFPMAESRDGPVNWYSANRRAIFDLTPGEFHVPRRLAKTIRQNKFRIAHNEQFEKVIHQCAAPRKSDGDTWINQQIIDVFCELHDLGYAHSVEAYVDQSPETNVLDQSSVLAGGLYGVAIGGAFFAESMFTTIRDASKVCLVALVTHLRQQGFKLLDVQFTNPHLEQFGVKEITPEAYQLHLQHAIRLRDIEF